MELQPSEKDSEIDKITVVWLFSFNEACEKIKWLYHSDEYKTFLSIKE